MVFGDNASGVGKGGSAIVRDEGNSLGIPTGWNGVHRWTQVEEVNYRKQNALMYEISEKFDAYRLWRSVVALENEADDDTPARKKRKK